MKSSKRSRGGAGDYREWLFRQTGEDTKLPLSPTDLADNLNAELCRLKAIEWLVLESGEHLGENAQGLSFLLGDIQERMKAMLDATEQPEK